MFETGERVAKGQFSQEIVGTIVGEYVYLASQLSNRRWKRTMMLCGALSMEQQPSLKVHSSQVNRRALYEPSSPTKGSKSDDE
jgi:hypothetical protein